MTGSNALKKNIVKCLRKHFRRKSHVGAVERDLEKFLKNTSKTTLVDTIAQLPVHIDTWTIMKSKAELRKKMQSGEYKRFPLKLAKNYDIIKKVLIKLRKN